MPLLQHAVAQMAIVEPNGAAPSKTLVALAGFTDIALHLVPIGIVQFADYVSDVFVVVAFLQSGETEKGTIGVACIATSIAIVWLFALGVMCLRIFLACKEDGGPF